MKFVPLSYNSYSETDCAVSVDLAVLGAPTIWEAATFLMVLACTGSPPAVRKELPAELRQTRVNVNGRPDLQGTSKSMPYLLHKHARTGCTCPVNRSFPQNAVSWQVYREMHEKQRHTGLCIYKSQTPLSSQPGNESKWWKELHFLTLHQSSVPISNISSRLSIFISTVHLK